MKPFFIIVFACIVLLFVMKIFWLRKQLRLLQPVIEMIESTHDIMYTCMIKPYVHYVYLSPSIEDIIGENQIQRHLENPFLVAENVHPDDYPQLERKAKGQFDLSKPLHWRIRNKRGEYVWYEEFIIPIYKKGEKIGWHGLYRDISASKLLQQELQFKATHDLLTHMYNRDYFEEQCETYSGMNKMIGIIVCDVDNLKAINDCYGHKVGDDIIRDAAKLIKSVAVPNTECYRIGGDEFVIFIHEVSEETLQQFLSEIEQQEYAYNERHNIRISISKGYAFGNTAIQSLESLYIMADNEMYRQKNKKKSQSLQENN